MLPGQDAGDDNDELVAQGPACVLVTDGAAPVLAFAGGRRIRVDVPAAPVVDTVGAGDAFGGAFLTWWLGNGLGRSGLGDPATARPATPDPHHPPAGDRTPRGGRATGRARPDLGPPDPVPRATRPPTHAAVVTPTRRGAEPPWAYE